MITNPIEAVEKVISTLEKHKCDGSCETHEGDAIRVRVFGSVAPMEFWYCNEAIREDTRRGLLVEIL